MSPESYVSFLVRIWRNQPDHVHCHELSGDWRGEIERIQCGTRWSFRTLDDLIAFLRQAAVASDATTLPEEDEPPQA